MGFKDLVMIDLDTIDYSNLNRQFLFRKHHVGHSKAEVARDAVLKFPHDPETSITAYHGNVKEGIKDKDGNSIVAFDMAFFESFHIVLNGLDNVDARRHINRNCLAAGVPLIESGTEGYLGQVRAIIKGKTQCYECDPPPPKVTYPICTLRNHPDKPVHCIVWAKDLLFEKVFGNPEEDSDLVDTAEGAAEGEGEKEAGGSSASAAPAPAPLVREDGESASAFAERVFATVFQADVERLLRMEELWKTRKAPTPLRLAELTLPDAASLAGDDLRAWSIAENASVFLATMTRVLETRADEVGALKFDKDDEDALDFVTAAANLRMAIFAIPIQSRWEVKSIAGNIIPAIATTNAIIAGFIVLEALKVLGDRASECRYAVCNRNASGRKRDLLLSGTQLDPPLASCAVCGTAEQQLTLDTSVWTVGQLIDLVAKKHLSFNRPTIDATQLNGDTDQLCEGEELDDDDDDERAKYERYRGTLLTDLPQPIVSGSALQVCDASQGELKITLRVHHAVLLDKDGNRDPKLFEISGASAPPPPAPSAGSKRPFSGEGDDAGNPGKRPATATVDDDDDLVMLE